MAEMRFASLDEFGQALRDWVNKEVKDDRLPASPDRLVSLGYELWKDERPQTGRKRTLGKFAEVLGRHLDKKMSAATLWRKVSGRIRPDKTELRGILAVLLTDGSKLSDEDDVVLGKLVELIAIDLDLWADPNVAWIFASHGEGILGHRDDRRMQAWRAVQSRRLQGLSDYARLPLTVWLLDATDILRQDREGYRCRAAVIGLIQDLLAAFATPLTTHESGLDVLLGKSPATFATVFSRDHSLVRRSRPAYHERQDHGLEIRPASKKLSAGNASTPDLGTLLLETSVVGLIGAPQKILDAASTTLPHAEGAFVTGDGADPRIFLYEKLLPDWILNLANLALLRDDGREPLPKALIEAVNQKTAVLGTKIRASELKIIGQIASEPYAEYFAWKRERPLSTCHYAYWSDEQRQEEGEEHRLDHVATPPEVEAAIEMVLLAAAGKLAPSEKATVGAEMLHLLWRNGIVLMDLRQFFDVPGWFPLPNGNDRTGPKE